MANRVFNPPAGNLEKLVVQLFGTVAFASGGANPTTVTAKGFTVTYNSATGKWLVTLTDPYKKLLAFNVTYYRPAASGQPTAVHTTLGGVDVANKTIQFWTLNSSHAAVNPGSDEVAYIQIVLGNSSV